VEHVSIFLDESAVSVCRVHEPCDERARRESACDLRYLVGVGACVVESDLDESTGRARLARIRERVAVRTGIASARRMKSFVRDGWHATDDLPEFADPLLEEIDTDGMFKGHVRYVVLSDPPTDIDDLYDHLYRQLLNHVLARYRVSESVDVVFEQAGGRTLASYERLINARWTNTRVIAQSKGDNILALADYLLFATMRYAARAEQLCPGAGCVDTHVPPIAAIADFDAAGTPLAVGHVQKDDRWHKMYFSFLRLMSSVVKLRALT
jgi:hypothetical protein